MTTPLPSPLSPANGRGARRVLHRTAAAILAGLALTAAAQAADGALSVRDPFMRTIIPARPAAGYFTLVNDGDAPRKLVGVQSPDCGALMLHRSVREGGQDRMEMVDAVTIPAHDSVEFAPGGYHLMCMSPSPAVRKGGAITVTLKFGDGSALATEFPVRGIGAK